MSTKTIGTVKETTNYQQFKFADNRVVTDKGIEKAKRNLLATGKKCIIPIIVTPAGIVRDGQHRLKACEELKIPVRYYTTSEVKAKHVATLQLGDKWNIMSFIKINAEKGLPSFVYLKTQMSLYSGYNISPSSFGVLFIGKSFTSKIVNDESFHLTNDQKRYFILTIEKLGQVLGCRESISDKLKTETWIKSLCKMFASNYNHEHLMNRLETTAIPIATSRTQGDVDKCLMDIYNYNLPEEDKVFLV